MIEVKEAVRAATKFLDEIFTEEKLSSIRLEEVEQAEGDSEARWYVTLSFVRPKDSFAALTGGGEREYKTISIDNEGHVLRMKIKSLPPWQPA